MIQIRITRAQRPAGGRGARIERAPKQIELFDVAFNLDRSTTKQESVDLKRIEGRSNSQAVRGRQPCRGVERQARALPCCRTNRQLPDYRILENDLRRRQIRGTVDDLDHVVIDRAGECGSETRVQAIIWDIRSRATRRIARLRNQHRRRSRGVETAIESTRANTPAERLNVIN